MERSDRAAEGSCVYVVLNRTNARMRIFDADADYEAFQRVLTEAVERTETLRLQRHPKKQHIGS
jgi:REP-associated tyrosine transposase